MDFCPKCGSPTLKGAEDERGIQIIYCPECSKVLNLKDFKPVTVKNKKRTLDSILGK